MANVLITGGSGVVGKHLTCKLQDLGYAVSHLSRISNPQASVPTYGWDIDQGEIDEQAFEKVDYIIHLAGANIGESRWTDKRMQLIRDSRVKSAKLILKKIEEKNIPIKAFITASAIGYYGMKMTDKIYKESDGPANDSLGKICQQWEAAADDFASIGIRTVKIRTGIVLTKQGGALDKMLIPIRLGFGSPIGNGEQFMPWIHIEDLCDIFAKAIEEHRMTGAYNAVAPDFIRNREFIKTITQVMKKPFWNIGVPAFLLKIIFGEMSQIILNGSRISSEKIVQTGFKFRYTNLKSALINLLN
ncbi:MAG: TIGR01777 family protein [Saprospiraceae bacterium]|nr:TIGR01777 family protein [Saprospiraceae bacterium]